MIGSSVGPYRILELLGSGGMGEVYLAEDSRLGRRVAVKVLPPEFAGDAARMARFEQEARATSALNHAGICTLHDVGTHEGQPFLVMEALEGATLRELIGATPLPTTRLLTIALQTIDALGEAHEKGVIHRDLKSANIFVTRDGRAKILDFGLAKLTADMPVPQASSLPTSAPAALTREGAAMGTVAYMSPEQARGQSLDSRSDLFSFGVVLYEMATGRLPFEGATEAVIFDRILNHEPPAVIGINPRLPTGLVGLINKLLQKDPADRVGSAFEIKGHLEEIRRAPGSLESILPAQHISSTAPVKPPPRPEEQLAGDTEDPEPGVADADDGTDEGAGDDQLSATAPRRPSIAVLSFESMSADPEDEFFASGLSEDIINALAHIDGLDVAARTSAFSFKGKQSDVREIGERLGVGTVLDGSIRKSGNRVRITTQLVDAADGYHLWSQRFDREMNDIFAIQDEITAAIVEVLQLHLVSRRDGGTARRATTTPEAYELFLKGRHFWAQRTPQSMLKAIEFFAGAIAIDQSYAAAYAGLADGYAVLGAYQVIPYSDARAVAWPAIEKAIELDPQLAAPHFSTGFMHLWLSDDWLQSVPHLRRAIELAPHDGTAHVYLGIVLAMAGRHREAVDHVVEAKRLDPLSPFIHAVSSIAYRALDDYDTAMTSLREALDLDPNSTLAQWLLAFCYRYTGRLEDALALAERATAAANRHPTFLGIVGYLYALLGKTAEALAILDEIEAHAATGFVSPGSRIMIYSALGDREKLLLYLRESRRQGGGAGGFYSTNRPDLVALRDDPLVGSLIRELPLWPPSPHSSDGSSAGSP